MLWEHSDSWYERSASTQQLHVAGASRDLSLMNDVSGRAGNSLRQQEGAVRVRHNCPPMET